MGKHAPPAPDYTQAAKDQGAANLETAKTQALLNNPNMVTPYGSSMYTMGPDGRPTMTQTLSPAEQAKLDASDQAQKSILGILNGDMGNISDALSGPFGLKGGPLQGGYDPRSRVADQQENLDFSGAPAMPTADEAARQAVTNAVYSQGARFLDPQFKQAQNDQAAQLANQGIVANPGDPNSAYSKATDQLARQKMEAYGNLGDQATQTGIGALSTLFGMGMQARQQGVNEITTKGQFHNQAATTQAQIAQALAQLEGNQRGQAYGEYSSNRTMPLNMLNALLSSSQVNNPTFQPTTPTSITPAPLLQGAQLQGQSNAATASANNGLLGSILGAGGSALGGGGLAALLALSDRRLKTDIKFLETRKGINLYSYSLGGEPQIGVMADEVEKIRPEAVSVGPMGFKMVDYSKLGDLNG
jgi:hypothetical protein